MEDEDPFDSILHLEDSIYRDAYSLGQRDGAEAGFTEGYLFGLEKGYDKYLEMGRLHGRALVWSWRISAAAASMPNGPHGSAEPAMSNGTTAHAAATAGTLPPLPSHGRLDRHVRALVALTDPTTLAATNTDDAVAAFDERLHKAVAKARIIGRILGEDSGVSAPVVNEVRSDRNAQDMGAAHDEDNIEDLRVPNRPA